MGKFEEALKKAGAAEPHTSAEPTPSKVVELSRGDIEELRLKDTRTPEPRVSTSRTFTDNVDPRLVWSCESSSPAAECFKLLRSKLMVSDSGALRRTIMVTSAEPSDGKSLVAANLAVSIAQGVNEYVLLVDCDLRRPSLHRTFGLRAGQGLHEFLQEGTSLTPYLLKTPVQKLTLLPAGQPSVSPSELLGSKKMRLLIEKLKARHQNRYIIFDTPPAQFTAETASLFSMVDGVLLVVRSGKTSREPLEEAIGNIGRENILGVVFNASHEFEKDYRYFSQRYQTGKA
jgi:protein-tyrosine kinase